MGFNNAVPDDDNDGVEDASDVFPFDAIESSDTDGDGIGNNADSDDDNDGFMDAEEVTFGSDPLDALSDPERDALAFYQATNGDGWVANTNWLIETDVCSWFGVTCDSNGRVTQLSMWSNNIDGPLSETIGNLRLLEVISLADNSLSGSIPETIGELDNLRRVMGPTSCQVSFPLDAAIWNN